MPCANVVSALVVFGEIVIAVKVGVVTETVAVPGVPGLFVAVIVTGLLVTATPVANPLPTIWTLVGSEAVHVTLFVMSSVELSVKVPVAVYCCWLPSGIEVLAGVTAMDVRVALVTVSCAVPVTPLAASVAVMDVVPGAIAVASPWVPGELLMVAKVVFKDFHVT